MAGIQELKERKITETPLFLFHLEMGDGTEHRWCTHRVEYEGQVYEPRIQSHNLFEMRADSENGLDSVMKLSLTLANADSYCSQIERSVGWKGARVTVRLVFYDLRGKVAASESAVIFRGVADAPDEITETALRLSVSNRMNLQRLQVPAVRIQRRCPWKFPATPEQRAEAAQGGTRGKHSPFYPCGYSPDVEGGCGNLNLGEPFESCDYTRAQCEQRGMFRIDQLGRETRRFGGIEFVPPAILVRSYGEKGQHLSPVSENEGRYNDFVPMVYGTAWYAPPVVFARNDGNLTRMEVLLGTGEVQGVLKVLVNDVEIPAGRAGANMTATGWYNVISHGARTGAFNPDFSDGNGDPMGDPYGSMAYLSVVVPNRINDGKSLPRIHVLLEGLKVARYATDGTSLGEAFDNNPAWVVLDLLLRSGWRLEEIDVPSFARTAAYCAEPIEVPDLYGNRTLVPRFQTNAVLRRRQSLAEVLRGIRTGSRLYLTHGLEGKLELRAENRLALQQPVKPEWSNSSEEMNGGWPGYEFGDGANGTGGILRRSNGEPAIRFWSRNTADTPNRLSLEFQDEFNEYQQDSLSLVDIEDVLQSGQEISTTLNATGIPNFHQAARILRLQLNKSVRGNRYVQFETSFKAIGLKPGDIITLTYLKEGYLRQPFRILSIAPGLNFWTAVITAQIHDDEWYSDSVEAQNPGTRRQPGAGMGLPRPLIGDRLDEDGETQFSVEELEGASGEASPSVRLRVGFTASRQPATGSPGIPLLGLTAVPRDGEGTLVGGQTLYYGVSAIGEDGSESPLSFLARAALPETGDNYAVQLNGLSFAPGTAAFHVYRGEDPLRMFRIAEALPVSVSFTDPGLPKQMEGPPDENFDHANFYWRFEIQPETPATLHSRNSIGNESLEMPVNGYRGMAVRITKGKGRGQERLVTSNTATELTLAGEWTVEPDASSLFVVADSGWRFGATGKSSPVEFEAPARAGATIHISGRSANVHDKECALELSPLTRWRIGGGGLVDGTPPPKPVFGLMPTGQGSLEVTGVGFESAEGLRTITAGSLTLYYWPEREGSPAQTLAESLDEASGILTASAPVSAGPGDFLQLDGEILQVKAVLEGGLQCEVERGALASEASPHAAGSGLFHLRKKTFILPFPKDFFGGPASGNYSHGIFLPDVRVAAAALVMRNQAGDSEPGVVCLTGTAENGLRTLAGGQIVIQASGYLAIESNVAPPLVVEETRSVRDIYAVVREAPQGAPVELRLRQDAAEYCRLTILAGASRSNTVSGLSAGPLVAGAMISLDILSAPSGAAGSPGRDLTVTIRL